MRAPPYILTVAAISRAPSRRAILATHANRTPEAPRMDNAIADVITFVMSNFTLTFLVVGLVFAATAIARAPKPLGEGKAAEEVLRWFLFWSVGVSFLYNFVMHVFFGEMAAGFIGWAQSPFQAEVGFASLGFAAVGFLAFRGPWMLRLGAILGPALFLWGAAGGHIYQMVAAQNFAPGNAGIVFWTDVFLPAIGFWMLWAGRREGR